MFIQAFEECSVKDLGDIIRFNGDNDEKALPHRESLLLYCIRQFC